MDLEKFVAETLLQIIRGVDEAQSQINKDGGDSLAIGAINPALDTARAEIQVVRGEDGKLLPVQTVAFDVAVTTTEGSDKSVVGGIRVVGVKIGAEGSATSETTAVSRIKFNVPIILPVGGAETPLARRPQQTTAITDT